MKLARYWSRDAGESGGIRIVARGWSDESIEAARVKAREVARRVAERLAARHGQRSQYPYGDRPLPEPVLRRFAAAAVTRNGYGALVLNTDAMMFVDIDRQDKQRLFTFFRKPPEDGIRRVAERHGFSARIYETAGGYRVIIAGQPFRGGSSEAEAILKDFGADPMYVRLCRMQESFRARLTPKPWRCGFRNPPVEFPFVTPEDEAKFQRWEAEYARRAASYATCRFVSATGAGNIAPEFSELIAYHDQETKVRSAQQLA
ncbi:conserved hypothetical protein [Candidatus Sulfopaludibacter sp. SbA6]|nr:conserved hypothetical protein [Candidatus Sulfopaludibacter sp. SbA6]